MSTIGRATQVIAESLDRIWGYDFPDWADYIAADLRDAGLITPEPKIIRTRDELAALDPDTVVTDGLLTVAAPLAAPYVQIEMLGIPAVVIATGDHVRAARRALEEA